MKSLINFLVRNKSFLLAILFLCLSWQTFAQTQNSNGAIALALTGELSFYEFDSDNGRIDTLNVYFGPQGFLIYPDIEVVKINGEEYILFNYYDFNCSENQPNCPQSQSNQPPEKEIEFLVSKKKYIRLYKPGPDGNAINGLDLVILKSEFDKLGKLEMYPKSTRILAFIVGVVWMLVIIITTFILSKPNKYQMFVFRVIFAIASAGFASLLLGSININIQLGDFIVTAGGTIAVFLLIYYMNAPEIVLNMKKKFG